MAMSGAERQKRYRERNGRNAGRARINLLVREAVVAKLDALAKLHGVFKQAMLERIILDYESLQCNDISERMESPEDAAVRLVDMAKGDVSAAMVLLDGEAKGVLPDFTWQKASGKHAAPEYRRFKQIWRCIRYMQATKPLARKGTPSKEAVNAPQEVLSGQMTFGF